MTSDDQKKLKELEESLAKELDQDVNLSDSTDSVISGVVELNPNIKVDTNPPNKEEYDDLAGVDISEDEASAMDRISADEGLSSIEVDNILNSDSPEFAKEMDELASNPEAFSNVQFDDKKKKKKKSKSVELVKAALLKHIDKIEARFPKIYSTVEYIITEWIPNTYEKAEGFIVGVITGIYNWFFSRTLAQKIGLLLLLPTLLLTYSILTHDPKEIFVDIDDFHRGYESEPLIFDSNKNFVSFFNAHKSLEFVVLLDKIVSNLRPSRYSRKNPLIAYSVFVETSNHESSVEIKDREKEFKDLMQRVSEEYTYDEMMTKRGKNKFKRALKYEVSAMLNTGVVRQVLFDNLLIKP